MNTKSSTKFWVVHNIPSPYRLHIFNALWKECKERGLDFHVHFMSDMSRGYDERPASWRNPKMDFPYTYWRDYGLGQRHINPGLLWHLRKNNPDYLLAGSPFDTLTGMFAGRMSKGVKCTWCEGNTKTPGKMGGVIGAVKRFALGGFDFVAVPGSDAAKYIELHQRRTHRKMPTPVILPNLVDESRFTASKTGGKKGGVRQAIIPARLKPVKGLMEFVGLLTPDMLQGWKIIIIGDGELKEPLLNLIAVRGLGGNIAILPFVPYEDMPRYYAESDLLILPSIYDPNPLSVVEAIHCGLSLALTSEAGNVEEAVTEGKNGWVLPVKEKGRFEEVLKDVFAAPREKLAEMGEWSLTHNAQYWNTERAIKRFVEKLVVSR